MQFLLHITSVRLATGQPAGAATLVHIDVFILTVQSEGPGDTFPALERSREE